MGEIGIMVSRLHQEGFDLEDMIDEELRAAGFLELCERTTRTLLQRAAAVEESHTALRRLLDSIDSQLKDFQGTAKAASSLGSSAVEASSISRDPNEKAKELHKTVIVIDDDEKEFVDVADMSCQATHEDIRNETQVHCEKVGTTERPPSATQTGQQSTSLVLQQQQTTSTANYINQQQTTSTANYINQQQTTSTEILRGYVPIRPAPEKDSLPSSKLHFSTLQTIPFSAKQNAISKRSDITESSASSVTKTPPLIYRTLKSPAVSGAPLLPHRVALMPSTPTLPVQQTVPSVKASAVSASPLTPPSNESVIPMPSTSLVQPPTKPTPSVNPATPVTSETTVAKETSVDVGPPEFDVGTRVIGQRADELWYPGVIEKILTDKHNQVKYKVKFDKGTRGLLSSNHISLESNPDPSVLNVGSRVVALRPRDTAEENASWRKPSTGIYGKLDVLYAGIVAEKACAENKSRFLVFFDDGFAQYLPVKKLHHVYHTGKKVWNECAEHSKEFIQEYLEEFPNRPMVKLRVNQWVKTEWRGQWLKAKVMQLDCSLIKMLFQIDNRSEWLYRGSTRMEPLYSALVDGKISKAKKKRSRKLTRGSTGKSTEPYIDYSITKPCFGVSPYSKTDPEGEQQHRLEEKRQQTQLEQLRQQEQQEELRDKNKQSPSSTTTSTTTSLTHTSSTSTSTVTSASGTTASGTTASPTEPVSTPSTGTTEDRAGEAPKPRPELPGPSESSKGQPSDSGAGGTNTLGNELPPPNFPPVSSTTRPSVPTREDSGGDCQSTTNCTASSGHCSGGVAEPECNSFGCCTDSSLSSVIQASTARKKTNAGFSDNSVLLQGVMATAGSPQVNAMDRIHRPHGIEVIDLDGDSTTAVLHFPMETDDIMSSLQSHKNEYLVPNADGSILDEIYDAWEAPWLRVNRRDIRSTGCNRAPAFQIPTINRRKQDVASLIEERLKQDKLGKTIIEPSIVPQLPIPVVKAKLAVKGPHKCGPQCISQECIPREEIVKHNPRSVPLLLKWKREIAQRHPGHKKTVYYRTPCNKRLRSMAETASYLTGTSASNVSIDQFTFDPQVSCQDTVFRDVEPIIPDISRGADAVQISVVNEVDTCYPPPIDYVSKRILAEGVNMVLDPGFLACCDCTDNCQDKSKCSCAQLTIQASAAVGGKENASTGYEFRRLKDCVQTGIYECNQNCACGSQCFNRVVQNGIQLRLQVFKTENRGWGLRALDDIPMGTFVCTYAGQILNEDMANKEGRDFGDEYLAELDHIEVVEKAKEGYESSVSDLEEDDSVIYKTLGGESSSTVSASEDSDASSLSGDESSEADSLFSEDSYSSGRNSRHGEGDSINHKPLRKKKRKRSSRKSSKRKRGVAGEESLVVERESKAYCLSNLADEKWCYIALKRSHDNQKEAAAFLRRVLRGEGPEDSSAQAKDSGESAAGKYSEKMGSGRLEGDDEDKNMQSSDFDFDDVGETFCQDMRAAMTSQRRMENGGANEPSLSAEKNVDRRKNREAVASHNFDIIDLTSDNEETDGPTCDEFRANGAPISSQQFQVKLEKSEPEKLEPEKADNKSTKSVEDENADSAPSLLSAEDLCKLAAKNQHLADEPPILTKMNPTRRLTNTLEDMISRLKGRVWTAPPSSDSSGPSAADGPPADEPLPMDFDQSSGEVPVDKPLTEQFLTVESPSGLTADPISEPSSPEIENMESFPPSPSSLRSDVSKPESLDRKSELSTGSSRRSGGGLSKPPVKKLKVSKPKIHYSRSHPTAKTASVSPSMKASPNTPSPSGPSLSRQSSVSIKRLSTRVMFGEEHCYVIDAKAYGNCGRYLNHSCSPNLFVQNVFVDTHDLRFPWVAFFTQQNVAAGTELTWDYAYEVGSVKGKVLHCYCGSADCRGRLL